MGCCSFWFGIGLVLEFDCSRISLFWGWACGLIVLVLRLVCGCLGWNLDVLWFRGGVLLVFIVLGFYFLFVVLIAVAFASLGFRTSLFRWFWVAFV